MITPKEEVKTDNDAWRRHCQIVSLWLIVGIMIGFILMPTMFLLQNGIGILTCTAFIAIGFGGLLGGQMAYADGLSFDGL